jgi:hypothetical protein
MPGRQLQDHLIILDGSVEARCVWSTAQGVEKSYAWELSVEEGGPGFALLSASAGNISVRAISDTQYVALSGDAADDPAGSLELARIAGPAGSAHGHSAVNPRADTCASTKQRRAISYSIGDWQVIKTARQ